MPNGVQPPKLLESRPNASNGKSNGKANGKPIITYNATKRGRPAEEWVKVEAFKDYGVRLYIDKVTLRRALELAGIDPSIPMDKIRVKRYDVFSGNKGEAQIILKIKVVQ